MLKDWNQENDKHSEVDPKKHYAHKKECISNRYWLKKAIEKQFTSIYMLLWCMV